MPEGETAADGTAGVVGVGAVLGETPVRVRSIAASNGESLTIIPGASCFSSRAKRERLCVITRHRAGLSVGPDTGHLTPWLNRDTGGASATPKYAKTLQLDSATLLGSEELIIDEAEQTRIFV